MFLLLFSAKFYGSYSFFFYIELFRVSSLQVRTCSYVFQDAVSITKWSFSKLKEHIEGRIEAENGAFDSYIWNVNLLEETFSTEGLISDGQAAPELTSSECKFRT